MECGIAEPMEWPQSKTCFNNQKIICNKKKQQQNLKLADYKFNGFSVLGFRKPENMSVFNVPLRILMLAKKKIHFSQVSLNKL